MRVLVFHGYLLRGTGSNVYNARLCAALARSGHSVDLLSQERRAHELDFVDAVGTWEGGRARVEVLREPVRVTVWRPDIGGVLPVYVLDRYEGIEARTLPDCSDAEVETYVEANVAAIREICARAAPDVALANHLVMGPAMGDPELPRRTRLGPPGVDVDEFRPRENPAADVRALAATLHTADADHGESAFA